VVSSWGEERCGRLSEQPQKIAGYEIEHRLSAGGISHGFEKRVAVKILNAEHFERPEIHQLFIDEARLAARLNHPNICQVFDFGVEEGLYYLVMEYVEGLRVIDLLRARSRRPAAMPPHLAARVIADAARGLHHAHELRSPEGTLLNVVHRDVSPDNIIVSYDGNIKLLDFGIARWAERASVTRHKTVRGKASYMSPEQVRGESVDRRADIFALGIVLFELLTGRRLFQGESFIETLEAVEKQPIPDVRRLFPELDEGLAHVVRRALQREAQARFASAEELTLELELVIRRLSDVSATEALARQVQQLAEEMGLRGDSGKLNAAAASANTATEDGAPSIEDGSPTEESPVAGSANDTAGAGATRSERRAVSATAGARPRTEEISADELRASFAPTSSSPAQGATHGGTIHSAPTQPSPEIRRGSLSRLVLGAGVAGAVLLGVVALALWGKGAPVLPPPGDEPAVLGPVAALDGGVAPLAGDAAQIVDASPADLARAASRPDTAPRDRQPKSSPRPKPKPKPKPKPIPEPEPAPTPQGSGTVSVFAHPWGNVRVDGKLVGPSPLVDHELSAGAHLIEVLAPDSNQVRERREITVSPGRHQKVRVRSP